MKMMLEQTIEPLAIQRTFLRLKMRRRMPKMRRG
jgi:hypothetical protein